MLEGVTPIIQHYDKQSGAIVYSVQRIKPDIPKLDKVHMFKIILRHLLIID